MTSSRVIPAVYRLVFAAMSLAALFAQLFLVHIANGWDVVSFFSYFTILGNLIASIVFIVSAARVLQRRVSSTSDVAIRGGSVVYMIFVGIVFAGLLRDTDLGALIPWVNIAHHYVMPIVVLLDWIIWPPQRRLPWRVIPLWMIFPAVYVVYSLIRGAAIGFYPYPFFNPEVQNGYGGVAIYCAVMLVAFVLLAIGVRAIGNARARALPEEA